MQNTADHITEAQSPLLTMWFHPRQTIRRIVETDPRQGVVIIVLLNGIVSGLSLFVAFPSTILAHWLVDLVAWSALYALVGLGTLYLMGFGLYRIGQGLKGQASMVEVRAAYAWPVLLVLPYSLALLPLVVAKAVSLSTGQVLGAGWMLYQNSIPWVSMPLSIWYLIAEVVAMAEVQSFSIKRAIACHVLTSLALVVVLMVVVAMAFIAVMIVGMMVAA